MLCDVYSLGLEPVFVAFKTGGFGIKMLQVHYGYRIDRIPESVLRVACGAVGKWRPESGDYPLLEIVPHHEMPSAWMLLPPHLRTAHVRKVGTNKKMVQVTPEMCERLSIAVLSPLHPPAVPGAPSPEPPDGIISEFVAEALPESHTGKRTLIDLPGGEDVPEEDAFEPPDLSSFSEPMPDLVPGTDKSAKPQCTGTTPSGARCKRVATEGGRCKAHPQAAAAAR